MIFFCGHCSFLGENGIVEATSWQQSVKSQSCHYKMNWLKISQIFLAQYFISLFKLSMCEQLVANKLSYTKKLRKFYAFASRFPAPIIKSRVYLLRMHDDTLIYSMWRRQNQIYKSTKVCWHVCSGFLCSTCLHLWAVDAKFRKNMSDLIFFLLIEELYIFNSINRVSSPQWIVVFRQ